MAEPIHVMCFTDVLCIFCYAADIRFERLKKEFSDQVRLTYHFMPVYGDVRRRLDKSGKSDAEYGAMARDIGDRFEHVEVHHDIFRKEIPSSSSSAHLYLSAIKLLEESGTIARDGQSAFERVMWQVREAFFRDLVDVSRRDRLDAIAEQEGIPLDEISKIIDSGQAFAELSHDMDLQREYKVSVTPTLVFNEGRQQLNGNVGYRVIEANIRELINKPAGEMSWC
jgi:predicted DsbA family dithiol-disulfide isomerase